MDRLSILMTLMTGAVCAGSTLVIAFSLGYQNIWGVLAAAFAGLLVSWPLSYWISRRIKRQDPNWHRTADPKLVPDPKAPEV